MRRQNERKDAPEGTGMRMGSLLLLGSGRLKCEDAKEGATRRADLHVVEEAEEQHVADQDIRGRPLRLGDGPVPSWPAMGEAVSFRSRIWFDFGL